MAFTKLEPTSVNTSATFTFSNASITGNLTVSNNTNLGEVGNITITGGTSGYVLSTDGSGVLSWVAQSGGGGGGTSYANSNVAAYLPTYTGNIGANYITASGNITAAYLVGNGSQLTGLPASYSNTQVAAYLPTYSGLVGGTLTTTTQPNISTVGTLTSLTVSGLVTATTSGIKTGNIIDSTGTNTINVSSGTVGVIGNLNVGTGGAGNVTATYFIGNGSQLTGLPASYANANVASYLPTYSGNLSPGNLTVGTSANLGAVGNVTITGGTSGYVLSTDGSGVLSWVAQNSPGGGFTGIAKDTFTATGSANTYTLSVTPENEDYIVVNIDGIVQQVTSYSLAANVVTISGMPESGETIEITTYSVGGAPGGSNTQIQFNDGGEFQGDSALTFDKITSVLTLSGNITTNNANLGNVANANIVNTNYFVANNTMTIQQVCEKVGVNNSTGSGNVSFDFNSGATNLLSGLTGNINAVYSNIPVTSNVSVVATLVITQGGTPYIPANVYINGVLQTILWNGGTTPTGTASKTEAYSFAMLNNSGTWTVLGQTSSFG